LRQVVIARHGTPEVLEVREGPDPTPREGEVRIAVRAAGVNFADILARLGLYPDAPPPPVVVGYEVSGYVDAVGPGTTTRHVGDHVFALTRFGGYSSAVIVPAALTFPVPADVSDAEAAAVPVNYLTALLALYRMANVAAHETVLMNTNRAVIGLNLGHLWGERQQLQGAMELLVGELAAGRIKPVVAKTFPLDRAPDAHRFIQSRSNIGKVVLMTGGGAGMNPS
jgi:NADPH:quinone reductase-like Zn-dependent oxidoreductase